MGTVRHCNGERTTVMKLWSILMGELSIAVGPWGIGKGQRTTVFGQVTTVMEQWNNFMGQ